MSHCSCEYALCTARSVTWERSDPLLAAAPQDLVLYRKFRNKEVASAARGLIGLLAAPRHPAYHTPSGAALTC